MENTNQTTYLTIGVTAIAGVIGLLGWHTYNNSSYEEEPTNIISHEEKASDVKETTETKNNKVNLKMSTPSFLSSFWKNEYDIENTKEEGDKSE
jgi:hypothetical protein